jgi:hypothetical protein
MFSEFVYLGTVLLKSTSGTAARDPSRRHLDFHGFESERALSQH